MARRSWSGWALFPFVWVLSLPWLLVVCGSHHLYRLGIRKPRRVALPVVSVGNVSLGGSGKTTACIYLARALARDGITAGVVLRGYRRKSRGALLVSDGHNVLADADKTGDEALLLANELPGCPVAVATARERAIDLLVAETDAQIVLLDDGFQYYRLARDVDIVLLDACTPPSTDRLFPAGVLREPYSHLSRATDVWITHISVASEQQRAHATAIARRYAPHAPIVATSHVMGLLTTWRGEQATTEVLRNRPIVAVAGIGNPDAFFKLAEQLTNQPVVTMAYPDHYDYTSADWDRVAGNAAGESVAVLTTPKDAVKMPPPPENVDLYVLHPSLCVEDGQVAVEQLLTRIKALAKGVRR